MVVLLPACNLFHYTQPVTPAASQRGNGMNFTAVQRGAHTLSVTVGRVQVRHTDTVTDVNINWDISSIYTMLCTGSVFDLVRTGLTFAIQTRLEAEVLHHCHSKRVICLLCFHTTALGFRQQMMCNHTCLLLRLYHICSGKSPKSIERSGNMDSLSKVPDSVIHETVTTNKHGLSSVSRE